MKGVIMMKALKKILFLLGITAALAMTASAQRNDPKKPPPPKEKPPVVTPQPKDPPKDPKKPDKPAYVIVATKFD